MRSCLRCIVTVLIVIERCLVWKECTLDQQGCHLVQMLPLAHTMGVLPMNLSQLQQVLTDESCANHLVPVLTSGSPFSQEASMIHPAVEVDEVVLAAQAVALHQ